MAKVETFGRGMIKRVLDDMKIHYLRDSDEDFVIMFAEDEDAGCELHVFVMAAGSDDEILAIRVLSDAKIKSHDVGLKYRVCNTWNRDKRWPKAYVDDDGDFILEEQIDLEKGIHQELLRDYIATTIAAGNKFWEWAHKEQQLF